MRAHAHTRARTRPERRAAPSAQGNQGGSKAVFQDETTHPSSHNISFGACYGHGTDAGGVPVSRLAQYSKQFSVFGAQSVRHMPEEFARLGAQLFSVLKSEGALSQATLDQGFFNSVQVRVYYGDEKAKTGMHTDTVVDLDPTTGELKKIDQVFFFPPPFRARITRTLTRAGRARVQLPDTDVAIYSVGDTMLLWRKPYERSDTSDPWPDQELVPLDDGSLFVWKTGPGSDDWRYKHGVFWPRKTDPHYTGPCAGQRRIAFVFRCTRQETWYQTAFPHREVVTPEAVLARQEAEQAEKAKKRRRHKY